jgi:hypothetical protein
MTIQADLAARFLDTMTAKLEKGRKAGADGVRIELADLDLLIKMAEPSADALDHVVSRMLEVIDSLVVFGVDLASGPDSTAATKVEIIDGSAKVIESKVLEPKVPEPSLTEALDQGNK